MLHTLHAELAAAVPHEHFIFHHQWCHGNSLTAIDVTQLRLPYLLTGVGIDSNCAIIQSVVEDLAVGIGCPTGHQITAGYSLGGSHWLRLIAPFHWPPGLGQVEGREDVRVRGDDVHRVVDDERGSLVST